MKFFKLFVLIIAFFMAIGSGSSGKSGGEESYNLVGGVAQKGPFVKDSSIIIYKLDKNYSLSSKKVSAKIKDNKGTFSLKVPWSGLSKIVVSGKYLNELNANISDENIFLESIIQIDSKNVRTNVNLLTHIASKKIIELLKSKKAKNFLEAKKIVNREFKEIFNFEEGVEISSLNIFKDALNEAKLLRFSAAVLSMDNTQSIINKLQDNFKDNNSSSFMRSLNFQVIKVKEYDLNITQLAQNIGLNNYNTHLPEIILKTAYEDINKSVDLKSSVIIDTSITHNENFSIIKGAKNGNCEAYLIGNEFWALKYTHNSCSLNKDYFIYKTSKGIGRVNIKINPPTLQNVQDFNFTVINSNIIKDEPIIKSNGVNVVLNTQPKHANATISVKDGFFVLNYDPQDTYIGLDSFKYTLTQNIGGCEYNTTKTITVNVVNKEFIYEDINITVALKQSIEFDSGIFKNQTLTFSQAPIYGEVNKTSSNSNNWQFIYTQTTCNAFKDMFVYETKDGYGRVNIDITQPSFSAADYNYSVKNSAKLTNIPLANNAYSVTISKQPRHGNLTLLKQNQNDYMFTYEPNASYEGDDYFEYNLTKNISGCLFSKVGRINIKINGITPIVTTQTLANPIAGFSADSPQNKALFGNAVAIEQNIIAVSEKRDYPNSSNNIGVVNIYKKTPIGVELIQTLKPQYNQAEEKFYFGKNLSFKNGYLAISSNCENSSFNCSISRVSIYKKQNDNSFSFIQDITQGSLGSLSNFANTGLAINDKLIVIGADYYHSSNANRSGKAIVYKITNNNSIDYVATIKDENITYNAAMGMQVALMDNLIIVSAPFYKSDINGTKMPTGKIFVYKYSNDTVTLVQTLKVPNELKRYNGLFGYKIATKGNFLAVGGNKAQVDGKSDAGIVYIYAKDNDKLVKIASIKDDNAIDEGNFGKSVAIYDKYVAIGCDKTANSDFVASKDLVFIYQYAGNNTYTKIGIFDAKRLSLPIRSNYKEQTGFVDTLAMDGNIVVASASKAFAYNNIGVKATEGGRVYLISCDTNASSITDYKKIIKHQEGNVVISGVFVPENNVTLNLSGEDASIFNINGFFGEYYTDDVDLKYNNAQDSNSDNIYNFNILITKNGITKSYPISLQIYKSYNINATLNSKEPYYNINNLYPLDSAEHSLISQSDNFAKKVLIDDLKVYASSKDKLFIFDRKTWDNNNKQSVDLHAKYIDFENSDAHAYFERFVTYGGVIAFDTTINNNKNDTNQTVYLYSINNLNTPMQIINFYSSSKDENYPHKDIDTKHIKSLAISENFLFIHYVRVFVHDDSNDLLDEYINQEKISVYQKNALDGKYEYLEDISVPNKNSNINESETDGYIIAKGEFLAFSYLANENGNRKVNIYKYDNSNQKFVLMQTINASNHRVDISFDNSGNHLVLQKLVYNDYNKNEIYKYNDNLEIFELKDTISILETGTTTKIEDVYKNSGLAKISGDYLIIPFYKRLEIKDFRPYNINAVIGDSRYLALFRWDSDKNEYVFAKSFTKLNGSLNFATYYEIKGNAIVTSTDGYMNMFEFVEK
jgi:hypothetical protein